MCQPEPKETFTIVAFRYNEKKSVLYRNVYCPEDLCLPLRVALNSRKADVISIRRVYQKRPNSST